MENKKTILILGGGVGGLISANLLRKKLSKDHRIILIDKQKDHLFAPSLLWLMTDNRKSRDITRPLVKLKRKNIEIINGNITKIDPESKSIEVEGVNYTGDYLIIALGADLTPENVPGLSEGGHSFYTLEGAEDFRDAWTKFNSGKLVILTSTPLYKCPAAPYEAAMLLKHDTMNKNLQDKIQVEVYTAESGPMGVTGPENSEAVRQMVEQKGIKYFPEHIIERVDSAAGKLIFTNGLEVDYDLLAYVPPHKAPQIVLTSGMVDASGWIPVDRNTLETSFDNVYAIGDVTGIPLSVGKPLPKAGIFAHYQAEVISHNITMKITGNGNAAQFNGDGECFIEVGGGKAGFGKGNFYAEPVPDIRMFNPGRKLHWKKVLFEKWWFKKWF